MRANHFPTRGRRGKLGPDRRLDNDETGNGGKPVATKKGDSCSIDNTQQENTQRAARYPSATQKIIQLDGGIRLMSKNVLPIEECTNISRGRKSKN